MKNTKSQKPSSAITPQRRAELRRQRRKIALELPELILRNQMSKEAKDEPTLSGELRRAIHSSELSLSDIATQAAIPPLALDEFLTGERTLRSDVLDRLAANLKMALGPRE